jgi:tyrosyl-tRNA synthetase
MDRETGPADIRAGIPAEIRDQYEQLLLGSVDALPADMLLQQLMQARAEGRPLRVKLGVDPTAPDIHLGHTVVLRKLRQFQEFGHTVVLIIGDYTGKVGDPSGRSKSRPQLSDEVLKANAHTYVDQVAKVLDMDKIEVPWNSEWLGPLRMNDVLKLTSLVTVARMLERDDFSNRYQANEPISMLEFMYPLLQGYDSVAVRADIEIGGTDQKFNLLMGRPVMEGYGLPPQSILTMPLLVGTDGEQKMSKSYGNYVGVDDEPGDMFGKIMSIPDGLMVTYLSLVTDASVREVKAFEKGLGDGSYHPAQAKRDLAERVVRLYHGSDAAQAARASFDRVFKEKDRPEDIPEKEIPAGAVRDGKVWLPRLLTETGLASSNGEARRLIEQGGVRIDDQVVSDSSAEFEPGALAGVVVQVGKRKFLRLR